MLQSNKPAEACTHSKLDSASVQVKSALGQQRIFMITVQVPATYLSHERRFLQIILRNFLSREGALEHQMNIVNVFSDLLFNGVAQI